MSTQADLLPRPLRRDQFKKFVLWLRQPPYESWLPILTGNNHDELAKQAFQHPGLIAENAETLITPTSDPGDRDGREISAWVNGITPEKAAKAIEETGWSLSLQYVDDEATRQRLIELGEEMLARLRNPIETALAESAV